MKKLISVLLCFAILCCGCVTAFATDTTIDYTRKGSMTIYKYDLTKAAADGLTDTVYLSTGQPDADAAAAFAPYAIPGAGFTIVRLGPVDTYTSGNAASQTIENVFGVENREFLTALGLSNTDAVTTENGVPYFESDTLINTLANRMTGNNTSTKDKLEAVVKNASNKQTLPLTDSTGKTSASNLELGLYLVVETSVPENITSTVDPCLVTLPMTDRVNHSSQHYEVSVYPKNQSGIPTVNKQVMDAWHGVSFSDAAKGYADVATLSGRDRANYRILSTVSNVHSAATYYTQYDFLDTLSKGLKYNQQDVKICWYRDATTAENDYTPATADAEAVQGTHADVTWNYGSEYFAVTYGDGENGASTMNVKLTKAGLDGINHPVDAADQEGRFSGWTMVIYYSATVNANESVTYGDSGNPNDVKLTWSRTTDGYSDTLTDTARVYSYGIDLTKVLSEGGTAFNEVEFILENHTNTTGAYYLTANKAEDGVYYITGGLTNRDAATHFIPDSTGKLLIYGMEEDSYTLTEVKTASGYMFLEDSIDIALKTAYTPGDKCGTLTASAKVDGDDVDMKAMGASANALIPFTVVNNRGFDLPKTGGPGTLVTTVCGVLVLLGTVAVAVVLTRKRRRE